MIRQQVDDHVATLATRVGRMQAQLLRLDALGKHLTEVGKLKRGEFDFDQPPALGGPETGAGEGPVIPALDAMIDSLDAQIDDRRRQLTALQSLILTREQARQIVPGGRPVESGYISSLYGQRPTRSTARKPTTLASISRARRAPRCWRLPTAS